MLFPAKLKRQRSLSVYLPSSYFLVLTICRSNWCIYGVVLLRGVSVSGLKHLSGGNFSLKRVVSVETVATEPVLLVVSAGSDPSQDLLELAESSVGKDHFHQVSELKSLLSHFT